MLVEGFTTETQRTLRLHRETSQMTPKSVNQTALALCFLVFAPFTLFANSAADISISLNRSRPQRGEVVEIKIQTASELPVQAVLLTPTVGTKNLQLTRLPGQQTTFRAQVEIGNRDPEGLYLINSWTGDKTNPSSVGKASFLLGRVVTDFFIPAYLDTAKTAADFQGYLKDFRS